jgi:uncharacterized membrane protein
MISVAGVTFSITMVAVTQASAQYSPRILRNFMGDRANQAVLGTFVGIFVYCLVVLRTIRDGEAAAFVPSLAVLVAILLALVGVAVLIFFVHHIAVTLQASEIIARIGRDTSKVLDRLHGDELDRDVAEVEPDRLRAAVAADAWQPILSRETGYIQSWDVPRLVEIAERGDLLIRLEYPTGEFVIEGQPLAWFGRHPLGSGPPVVARKAADVTESMARTYIVGTSRTLDHDPAFGFRQLVDIALKALSPGINDSATALTCIDRLGALLVRLADRPLDGAGRDAGGRLRVLAAEPDFEALLDLAVDEIRRSAGANAIVHRRLLRMLEGFARATHVPARRRAAMRQAELVHAAAGFPPPARSPDAGPRR